MSAKVNTATESVAKEILLLKTDAERAACLQGYCKGYTRATERAMEMIRIDAQEDGQRDAQIYGKLVDPMGVICVAAVLAGLLGLAIVFWL